MTLRSTTLASDSLEVELLPEAGARLHRLRAFGHDLLRTPTDPGLHLHEPFFWGGYVMAPWCNRVAARPIGVDGTTITLPPNFRDGTAIHGQVYAAPWSMDGLESARAEMSVLGGGDGWPWRYAVGMHVTVADRDLRIDTRLSNLADAPMPAGVGLHPWFVGHPEVVINADLVFDSNTDSPPQPRAVHAHLDRRAPGVMTRGIDATWTGLRDPAVSMRWVELGIEADMTMDDAGAYVCAASPTDIEAVAIEPQTHAPDGLRRLVNGEPGALRLLEAGGTLSLTTTFTFRRTEEDRQ